MLLTIIMGYRTLLALHIRTVHSCFYERIKFAEIRQFKFNQRISKIAWCSGITARIIHTGIDVMLFSR